MNRKNFKFRYKYTLKIGVGNADVVEIAQEFNEAVNLYNLKVFNANNPKRIEKVSINNLYIELEVLSYDTLKYPLKALKSLSKMVIEKLIENDKKPLVDKILKKGSFFHLIEEFEEEEIIEPINDYIIMEEDEVYNKLIEDENFKSELKLLVKKYLSHLKKDSL